MDRPDEAPPMKALWFYRTLRNAAIDQFRRRGAASNAGVRVFRAWETLKKR